MGERLLNCNFVNAGGFAKLSNKSKLLYLLMFTHADDKGFVDIADKIIESLENSDNQYGIDSGLALLQNDYTNALNELVDKGYLYLFTDNHKNNIYLIRHWYYHNKYYNRARTNYYKYLKLVELQDNKYVLIKNKKSKTKEKDNDSNVNKVNKVNIVNKVNGNETNESTPNEISDDEWNKLFDDSEKELDPNDYPFEIGGNNGKE